MKKVLCAMLLVFVLVGAASADVVGMLSRLNVSPERMQAKMQAVVSDDSTFIRTFAYSGEQYNTIKFYDSMTAMLMALNAGEIYSMYLPECVGEYVLNTNPKTEVKGFLLRKSWLGLALGLREKDTALRGKFNAAIDDMTKNGKLALLEKAYISAQDANNTQPAVIEKYDGAETLKVAVTGGLPPIDYIAPDGTPAGFNTAVLAELGRRLHVNIQLVQVDAGARAAALMSGRVGVVFWFETLAEDDSHLDEPEGIIITKPYYSWNKALFIGLKK